MQGKADSTSTVSQATQLLKIPLVTFKCRIASIQTWLKQQYTNLNNFDTNIMKVELAGHKTTVDNDLISCTFPDTILSLPLDNFYNLKFLSSALWHRLRKLMITLILLWKLIGLQVFKAQKNYHIEILPGASTYIGWGRYARMDESDRGGYPVTHAWYTQIQQWGDGTHYPMKGVDFPTFQYTSPICIAIQD